MNELKTTGQRIFWLRKIANMKQKDLAEVVGVAQGYLSELEADKKEPGMAVAVRIADVLGTSIDYLMLRTNEPEMIGHATNRAANGHAHREMAHA